MTVYVDDWRQPALVSRLRANWSHLTVGPFDDLAELHALARKIGLRRSWFQDKPWPRSHYDVTDSKRHEAINAGAVTIPWREAGQRRIRAIEARRRAAELLACKPGGRRGPPGREDLWPVAWAMYELAMAKAARQKHAEPDCAR